MKKLLILLLILALVLPIVSCTKEPEAPEEPENTESEEILATESDSESESAEKSGDNDCLEIPYAVSKEGYTDYKEHREKFYRENASEWIREGLLPNNFVCYSALDGVGNIEFLEFTSYYSMYAKYRDFTRYKYDLLLTDEGDASQKMSLWVLHGDFSEDILTDEVKEKYLPAIYFREEYPQVHSIQMFDLEGPFVGIQEPSDFFYDGLRYTYGKDGYLREIHWQSGDTKFWITFDEPVYIPHAKQHPFMAHFFDRSETDTAIAWFDELITFKEPTSES